MTTNALLIRKLMMAKLSQFPDDNWIKQHLSATYQPKGFEVAHLQALNALAALGDATREAGRSVKDCYFTAPLFLTMARTMKELLNTESGRLDCGLLSSTIDAILENEGFNSHPEDS
jgi:hypothetical protein